MSKWLVVGLGLLICCGAGCGKSGLATIRMQDGSVHSGTVMPSTAEWVSIDTGEAYVRVRRSEVEDVSFPGTGKIWVGSLGVVAGVTLAVVGGLSLANRESPRRTEEVPPTLAGTVEAIVVDSASVVAQGIEDMVSVTLLVTGVIALAGGTAFVINGIIERSRASSAYDGSVYFVPVVSALGGEMQLGAGVMWRW